MSKADEMFEELGYKLTTKCNHKKILREDVFEYTKKFYSKTVIYIGLYDKIVGKVTYMNDNYCYNEPFELEELKAINEKCKELGWL